MEIQNINKNNINEYKLIIKFTIYGLIKTFAIYGFQFKKLKVKKHKYHMYSNRKLKNED